MKDISKIGKPEKLWGFNKKYSLVIWGLILIIIGLTVFLLNNNYSGALIPSLSGRFNGPLMGSFFSIGLGVILLIIGLKRREL